MKILVKDGVVIKEINVYFLRLADVLMKTYGFVNSKFPTITSCNDSKHMIGSLHYEDLAWDLRTRDLTKEEAKQWSRNLASHLGKEFQVILEKDHIHVEFDPN